MNKVPQINAIEIIAKVLEVPVSELVMESSMMTIQKWDSLMHMCIVAAIEKELKRELEIDEIASAITVKDFHNIIIKYIDGGY